jgi:hypothetical protein
MTIGRPLQGGARVVMTAAAVRAGGDAQPGSWSERLAARIFKLIDILDRIGDRFAPLQGYLAQ